VHAILRWLRKIDIQIGRQKLYIPPVHHLPPGAGLSNLIVWDQLIKSIFSRVCRARGCCMKDRLGANGSHCQLLSYHLSLTQMHKRWRKGNLVSRVVLHVKRQRWGSGTGFRRSLSENLLFLAVCLKRYVLWWVKVVRS